MAKGRINHELLKRIDLRLAALDNKSARAVCRAGGIDESTINNLRQGKTYAPTLDTLRGLAKGLQCTCDYLTGAVAEPGHVNDFLTNMATRSGQGELNSPQLTGAETMTDNVDDLLDMLEVTELSKWPKIVNVYRRMTGRADNTVNPQGRRKT